MFLHSGVSDNSFLEIPANGSTKYEVQIPANHPSGLFWYHPHMHGAVARQVSRGLAGLIVIRGDFDEQPEVIQTPEFPFVLQDFSLDSSGQVIEPTQMERTQGREGPLATVNAASNPTIPLAVNGWVRLRILNASVSKSNGFDSRNTRLQSLARMGACSDRRWKLTVFLSVPGQRYDVFVRGRAASGRFRLMNVPYSRFGGIAGGMGMAAGDAGDCGIRWRSRPDLVNA